MKCPNCGIEIGENEKYCKECGLKVTNNNQVEETKIEEINPNKEVGNNKEKNKKIIIFVLIGVILAGIPLILILTLIMIPMILNIVNPKEEINKPNSNITETIEDEEDEDIDIMDNEKNDEDENTTGENDEEELLEEDENIHKGDKYEKYYYLVDRLISPDNTTIFDKNFDIKNINNDFMLLTALFELDESDASKMDVINHKCYTGSGQDRYVDGYKSDKVIKKAKEIFGKNINISITKDKTINPYTYIKDSDGYVNLNDAGCGMGYYGSMNNFIIDKVEDTKTKIVITGTAYYFQYHLGDLSNVDSSTVIKKYEDSNNRLDVQQYVRENKNKFNQYKFTFTLEDGNYIFTGIEKLK